ncbi:MAG: indolepyruvate ferredoxin oxidoreductase family protein, partial [Sinobacterium sp.]
QRDQERGLNTAGFVSGYRGSPLAGVDQAMWKAEKYLEQRNIKFVPGVNEDLAATAVRGSQEVGLIPGSQFDGVFGMWYGKGPGLDRSMDAIRHANVAGTSKFGGVLAVVGDDHGCKSSTYPFQSEHLFTSLSMPVLAPANVQEVLDLGIFGWELSRYCGCWVGLKAITENMDSAISAEIDPKRINIRIPENFELPADGLNVRLADSPLAQEERLNKYKIYAALAFARENNLNRIVINSGAPKLGIITAGKSYLDVLQAFDDLGIDEALAAKIGIRLYKVGMPWPLEPVTTHEFAKDLDEILVVEENRSVMEDQLTGQLYNWPLDKRPRVVGEYDEHGNDLLTNLAELSPAMIARVIAARLARYYTSDTINARVEFINSKEQALAKPRIISSRDPMYCSGCPHNSSTVVPEGSIAGGGIGCHYMSTFSETRPAHGFTHMGGEGVTWTGMAPFTSTKHIFQNLGDGTYFHSGVLAIRQSIASKVNITYKILFNDAVAMTGGQPLDGSLSVPQLIQQLKGEGIQRIELVSNAPHNHRGLADAVVSVSHRDNLNTVQLLLRETTGTSILIYEQTCATEMRRRRKRGVIKDVPDRVFINSAVCEGCGDCSVKSNCLAVVPKETELGRKRQIDQAACNKDYSCTNGFCPSFVTVSGGQLRKNKAAD